MAENAFFHKLFISFNFFFNVRFDNYTINCIHMYSYNIFKKMYLQSLDDLNKYVCIFSCFSFLQNLILKLYFAFLHVIIEHMF